MRQCNSTGTARAVTERPPEFTTARRNSRSRWNDGTGEGGRSRTPTPRNSFKPDGDSLPIKRPYSEGAITFGPHAFEDRKRW